MKRGDIVFLRTSSQDNFTRDFFDDVVWIDETWVNVNHTMEKGNELSMAVCAANIQQQ